jgi:hypothetical protein
MLRIIAEIHISDEREDEIVQKTGLRHQNLIRYINRKLVDMFNEDHMEASVKEIRVEPMAVREPEQDRK